jgi:hypothetical protein
VSQLAESAAAYVVAAITLYAEARTVRGGWRTARPSPKHCQMPISTRSGFRD